MGGLYSAFNGIELDLPSPIKEYDLENNIEESIKQFRDNYRNLGYVVIEMKDDFNDNAYKYR